MTQGGIPLQGTANMLADRDQPTVGARSLAVGCVLLAAVGLYQLAWAWLASLPMLLGTITNDDVFLYLEFAVNTLRYGFPTFDGINATNGVQPLWAALLVALASAIHDKEILLRTVLTLCAALNVATGLVLLHGLRRWASPVVAVAAVILWSAYMLGLQPAMLGMENSLHALVAAATAVLILQLFSSRTAPPARLLLWIGLLLAANGLTRLDSAVVSIVLAAVVVGRGIYLGGRPAKVALCTVGPGIAAGALLFAANFAYFGTPTPVSCTIKQYYASFFFDGFALWERTLLSLGMFFKTLSGGPERLFGESAPEAIDSTLQIVALLVLIIPAGLRVLRSRAVDRSDRASAFSRVCVIMLAASLVHLAVMVVVLVQFSIDPWYYSWLFLTWILCLAWAIERWYRSPVMSARASQILVAALLAVLLVGQVSRTIVLIRGGDLHDIHVERLELTDWINRHIPADAVLASWNAGELAYFTDQTFINLDGLMNSRQYADFLYSGGNVLDYLRDAGVDIVVDFNTKDSTMPYMDYIQDDKFRNLWYWDQVKILHAQTAAGDRPIYVVDLPGGRDFSP